MHFKPHNCPHARTTIYRQGDKKVEECKQCGSIVDEWEKQHYCEAPVQGGGLCRRKVDSPEDVCWQHAE